LEHDAISSSTGFHFSVTDDDANCNGDYTDTAIVIGQTYSLEIIWSGCAVYVEVDGVETNSMSYVGHESYVGTSYPVYISNSWETDVADVVIENLQINSTILDTETCPTTIGLVYVCLLIIKKT
jgi:hypothetical protein